MPGRVHSLECPAEPFNEEMLIRRVLAGEHELFYEKRIAKAYTEDTPGTPSSVLPRDPCGGTL